MSRIMIFTALLLLLLPAIHTAGQEDTCPDIVRHALEVTGSACGNTGRNQICYGNTRLEARFRVAGPTFARPGDLMDVADLETLTTYPLDADSETWGIALLKLQADIPDTLPGQNVTFIMFGDAKVENEVDAAEAAAPAMPGVTTGQINLRSGPGTGFPVTGTLGRDAEVTVVGRSMAADWALIRQGADTAWVFASLLVIDGDLAELPVAESGTLFTAPMQAFRLTTGVGPSACVEMPTSGLLVQSPQGLVVNFRVNGVEVALGSTALFRTPEADVLRVINIGGSVTLRYRGETVTLAPGESVNIRQNSTPGQIAPYQQGEARSLPLGLLPDEVSIPPVIISMHTYDVTGNGVYNLFPITFANDDGDAIVTIVKTLISATGGTWFSGEVEIDEEWYDSAYGGEIRNKFSCQATRTHTVTYAIRLVDAAGNTSPPYYYTVSCRPP